MPIADDMKRIAENIIASHDMRAKMLSGLVADTHKVLGEARRTVKGFAQERKAMASKQAEGLSDFIKDLTRDVGNKLKDAQASLKQMSQDRSKMSKELKARLAKEVKDIVKGTEDILDGARDLISGFEADMGKAKEAWQNMSRTLARSGRTAAAPKTGAAGKTARKKKKRGRKKKS